MGTSKILSIHCLSLDRARPRDKQWSQPSRRAALTGTGRGPGGKEVRTDVERAGGSVATSDSPVRVPGGHQAPRTTGVIGKVVRGADAGRLLYYLYGPGRANEHTDPHLVAGFGDPAELEPEHRPNSSRDLRRLGGLLAQPLAATFGPNYDKPVWHCSVRSAPGDRVLSDEEWAQVAAGIMDRTGLAPKDDDLGVRWVAVRHAPDHIHIVATLARQDGIRPKIWNDFYRVREACQAAERSFGLQQTAPADRTAARRVTRAETEQAARRGWQEAPRVTLRREVCAAAAAASTEQEFFARLRESGALVRLRFSAKNPGEVTGYAVGLAHHTTKDGEVVWYGGGKLAADLTLPKLRHRWQPRSTTKQRPGQDRFAAPRRNAAYAHAAREARAATTYIRHCSRTDPARGADAAWAAADALHVAARMLQSLALRCAADAYDRAARAPYGRLPRCTPAGDRLRLTARLIAATGPDSEAGQAGELVISFALLAAAVADLRAAQRHAAQAAAARTAAEHLLTQVQDHRRNVSPKPVHEARQRPARASDVARRDVPVQPMPSRIRPIDTNNPAAGPPHPSRAPSRRKPRR
jgi:hypothetical protein